jgi:predicted dehydrogenase
LSGIDRRAAGEFLLPLKVAVLGSGSIGSRHLGVLRALSDTKVIAVPIRPERRAVLASAGYAVAQNLEDAAAQGARQVIIATDTGRHLTDAQSALRLGFALLVEKPLAATAIQAASLRSSPVLSVVEGAVGNALPVFVACVLRFSESLNTFRRWLPRVGPLHSVRIECQSYLPDWRPNRSYRETYAARADEGGVLRDLIHEIDYAGWLFGWPRALQASVRNLGRLGIAAEESAALWSETETGAQVILQLDYLTRPTRRGICASGENGTLIWDGVAQKVTLLVPGEPPQEYVSTQVYDEMFAEQARAFLAVRTGEVDPRLAGLEDGVKALGVCDAARLASNTRREEEVTYP